MRTAGCPARGAYAKVSAGHAEGMERALSKVEEHADQAAVSACDLADEVEPDGWSQEVADDALTTIETLTEALGRIPRRSRRPSSRWLPQRSPPVGHGASPWCGWPPPIGGTADAVHDAGEDRGIGLRAANGCLGSVGVDAARGEDLRRVRHGQDAVLHEGDLPQVGQQGEVVERADVEQVVLAVPGGGAVPEDVRPGVEAQLLDAGEQLGRDLQGLEMGPGLRQYLRVEAVCQGVGRGVGDPRSASRAGRS